MEKNELLELVKEAEFHEPEYYKELIEMKELILKDLQRPIDDLVDWKIRKGNALRLLKQLGFAKYENETIDEDVLIKRPPYIKRNRLNLSKLIDIKKLPGEMLYRLTLLNEAELDFTDQDAEWYRNEIKRCLELI